jgi:hypothetical protein
MLNYVSNAVTCVQLIAISDFNIKHKHYLCLNKSFPALEKEG